MLEDFLFHLVSAPLCRSQCGWQKQYVGVRIFPEILTIFVVHSIQFFIQSSKISKSLKLNQNWCFYTMYSRGTISLEEGFLISYQECEEFVSLNEDAYCDSHCGKIVRKLWVEMNTLNVLLNETHKNTWRGLLIRRIMRKRSHINAQCVNIAFLSKVI